MDSTPIPRCTQTDISMIRYLYQLARGHAELWHATKTIARNLGLTVRAVQVRLQRLCRLGFLERVWDWGLKTRRAYRFLGAPSSQICDAFCAHDCDGFALTRGVPPDPPIEVPDGNPEDKTPIVVFLGVTPECEDARGSADVDGTTMTTVAFARDTGVRSVGSILEGRTISPDRIDSRVEPNPDEPPRKATEEEVEAVVAQAREVFPHVPDLRTKVRDAAGRRRGPLGKPLGLRAVSLALDWARTKQAASWRYVEVTLDSWAVEGVPGPPVARQGPSAKSTFNPPPPLTPADTRPLTEAELADARRWAEGGDRVLRTFGRKILELHENQVRAGGLGCGDETGALAGVGGGDGGLDSAARDLA